MEPAEVLDYTMLVSDAIAQAKPTVPRNV